MKNFSHHSPNQPILSWLQGKRKALALLAILILFLINVSWSLPYSSWPDEPARAGATHTLVPTHSNLVNTPSLEEIQSNHTETDGIAIVGGIIVLMILAGTFFVLRRKL